MEQKTALLEDIGYTIRKVNNDITDILFWHDFNNFEFMYENMLTSKISKLTKDFEHYLKLRAELLESLW